MSSPSEIQGRVPEALALFMSLERKILQLINIPAPNLLKLTSRKRDIHEKNITCKVGMMLIKVEVENDDIDVGDDGIDTILYNIMTLKLQIQVCY